MIVGENGVVSVSGKKAGLNSSTACIFQDFYQYQTTVRENIEMGDPGRKLTDEEIWELLDTVGLREKVEGLEQGLDTRLGQLDGQGDFSKGQWQRIAIARAIVTEPEVIFFDEPTSALDPVSTLKIEELLLQLKKRYTIVIVTHNMQQAARISDYTAFFLLGELIEYGETEKLFSRPECQKTEDYITGRFG